MRTSQKVSGTASREASPWMIGTKVSGLLVVAGLMAATSPVGLGTALAEVKAEPPAAGEQLSSGHADNRGWLGVKIQTVDADTAVALGMADNMGVLITDIVANSPAASSELKTEDVIVSVNGTKIKDGPDLVRLISGMTPETEIDLQVWRGGTEQKVALKLGKLAANDNAMPTQEKNDRPKASPPTTGGRLGLQLAPATAFGSDEGVAIADVDPNSDAARKGLKAGDIILRVDGQAVSSPEAAVQSVKSVGEKGKRAVLLSVKSGGETRSVSVRFS